MKKYYPLIFTFLAIKLIIHLIGNQNYGFHRDELLHLSVSEKLAWGYFEFPPFIAFVGKLSYWLFDYNLLGVRMFSTLAGLGMMYLMFLTVLELEGKKKAVILSGVTFLIFLAFFRNHCLFQPVAFDQFFLTLAFYLLVKYLKSSKESFLIWIGIVAGFGFLNKYTFGVFLFGIIIGLFFTQGKKLLTNKQIYIAGLFFLIMILPNLIWQYRHDFPLFLHLQKLKESQLNDLGPFDFVIEQLKSPFTLIVVLFGLYGLFFKAELKSFKSIGIATIVIFFAMWFLQSKGYYFFSVYPVLFAIGAVVMEDVLKNKTYVYYGFIGIVSTLTIFFLPDAIPILPIDKYIEYKKIGPNEAGRYELTSDYADMFGWEEQVKLVDSVYKSLPKNVQSKTSIYAENYGEAGAITILGRKYNLPKPICSHGSFWTFGAGKKSENYITLGLEKEVVEDLFQEQKLIRTIHHKYAIDEENNIPVYFCSTPKKDIQANWFKLEKYVFD
ncbi:MAG: glycosyltransferase family 39 protein [Limnohabitans sp.]|nr:glycosyltransferase family 39 protein [Limnohabitans sp.]